MVHGHVWRTVCSVCALDENPIDLFDLYTGRWRWSFDWFERVGLNFWENLYWNHIAETSFLFFICFNYLTKPQ